MNVTKVDKWMLYCVYTAFVFVFVFVAVKSLLYPYLCYDEAGQFYISKGLFHCAEPYSSYSGLKDVIYYNRYFNLDPGGFSVLLHYWSMVSNHYLFLRFLPFVFFLGALGGTFKIGMYLFKNCYHAILLVSVILFTGVFAQIAGEIRAYSMELCGVILSMCYLQKNIFSLTTKKIVNLALMLVFFMTSRYGFVVYAFGLSLCVMFLVYRQKGFRQSIVPLSIYAGILLCGILFVYLVTMRYQNANAEPLSYVKYLGKDFDYLKLTFLSRLYGILFIYCIWCYLKKIPLNLCIYVAFVVSTVFVVLSLANLYPWDVKRALSMTACLYLSIGIMILKHLKNHRSFLAGLFFIGIFNLYDAKYEHLWWRVQGKNLFKDFEYCIMQRKPEAKIFVGMRLTPQVRYLFEEGEWKYKYANVYPNHIILGNGTSHNMNGEKLKIDVVNADDVDAQFFLMTKATWEELDNPSLFKQCGNHPLLYTKETQEFCE